MPKGALLHAHLEATVDAKTVLDMAIKHANICIRSSAVVTVDNYGSILPDFFPLATSSTYTSSPSITSPEYTPDIYVSAQKVRNEWPEALGGSSGFDSWVVKAMTINPEEAYGTHNTTVKVS
jgi:adenosine deaminase CECR1